MEQFVPPAAIDTLFDYRFINKDKLAQLSTDTKKKRVAIIGAGAAGICSGYELLKIGIIPTIYEVNPRIGGRIYTQYFNVDRDLNRPYAELGAMRVPASSHLFLHYAKMLKLSLLNKFPNPGKVDTLIQHERMISIWMANKPIPKELKDINLLMELFLLPLREQLFKAWRQGDTETVIKIWQYYLDQYSSKSFFEVLNEHSPLAGNQNLIRLFGTLGFGHGGFHSLYTVSFIEFLRLIVNCLTENNLSVEGGMITFLEKLTEAPVTLEDKSVSLKRLNCIRFSQVLLGIEYNDKTQNPLLKIRNENSQEVLETEFDAVIYTGTICAAHLLNFTSKTPNGFYLFSDDTRRAIRDSYMVSSSKTFILTKNKFWKRNKFPTCYITDELTKASYFIDLPGIKEGVVCLSYTWGMDSLKIMAVEPQHLLIMFKRIFEKINPEIAHFLEPVNKEIIHINWINEKYQNGAFKLLLPGYEHLQEDLYFQFQSVLTKEDKGVYLAGDSISWQGGWIEGALTTAINAVSAVAKRFNGRLVNPNPVEHSARIFKYK